MEKLSKYKIIIYVALSALFAIIAPSLIQQYFADCRCFGPSAPELGEKIINGLVPYRDFSWSGAPGPLFIYALFIAITRNNLLGLQMIEFIWHFFIVFSSCLFLEKYINLKAAIIAGIVVIFLPFTQSIFDVFPFVQIPIMMALFPMLLGLYFYKTDKIGGSVMAGMFIAVSSLLSYFMFIPLIGIAIFSAIKKRDTWEPRPRRSKMFSFLYGSIIVYSMLILYLILSRAIDDFFVQTFLS